MRFHIQQESDIPASTQLYNQICFAIAARHYPPGHRLPSTRQRAMQTGLHRNTISKVYRQLEMDGVVQAIAGSGIYVRDNLKERILKRKKNMFLSGIIEETNHLICKYGCNLPILETIGYREARDVLNNDSTIDKAIELTATKTIQFAKRQKTWFRNKNNPLWLNNKNLLKDAIIKVESFLS